MPETTPLIKAALNLRGGAGFDVYDSDWSLLSIQSPSVKTVHMSSNLIYIIPLRATRRAHSHSASLHAHVLLSQNTSNLPKALM